MTWSDTTTNVIAGEPENVPPKQFILEQNYPNPFNSATTINYTLPDDDRITITIYNILGQPVRRLLNDEFITAGTHSLIWNGRDVKGTPVPSGLYIYQVITNKGYISSRRMVFVK